MKNLALLFSCLFLSFAPPVKDLHHKKAAGEPFQLIVLDPAHQHGAQMQNQLKGLVDPLVHVYAPPGPNMEDTYLQLIKKYNAGKNVNQVWELKIYTGKDYLEKMLQEKAGNVVLLAGNNQKKITYIERSVDAGINVIADKPMTVTPEGFEILEKTFSIAKKKNLFISDLQSMSLRNQMTNILQKEFSQLPEVFGKLEKGSLENPAIIQESTHAYDKGIVRPAWFFDVEQQGNGLSDITTHLVDLIQWGCFPEKVIRYKKDIKLLTARQWATEVTFPQFKKITQVESYPVYLKKSVKGDKLFVDANGEMNYTLKGVHAKVSVIWEVEAPKGAGDRHYSLMRGTKANLVVRQEKEQNYKSVLYIEPVEGTELAEYEKVLMNALTKIQQKYPEVELVKKGKSWEVVPKNRSIAKDLTLGNLPAWESPNMLAKYYTTTQAVALALSGND